jgi:lysophospholipase L1-like esterase
VKIYWVGLLFLLVSFKQHAADLVPNENVIVNYQSLKPFFRNLDSLLSFKDNVVNIVHIGDSHIQADFLTSSTRCLFQETFGNAGRGFVFPYRIAQTGGALDVRFEYSGNWDFCEIMRSYQDCELGVAGYSITAHDSASLSLDVASRAVSVASFNHITILDDNGSFLPSNYNGTYSFHKTDGRTDIYFSQLQDSLSLLASCTMNDATRLQGMILQNGKAGVLYHAMGVNGSSTLQYLRSKNLENEMAELNANLVIVSFGTNDSYLPASKFCASCVKERYRKLVTRIKKANPGVPILITTPPDHYYFKRQSNENIEALRIALYNLCREENIAMWDLFHIMGGPNSIKTWQENDLARKDLIHFNKEGYKLQGELLYNAIMRHYEER